MKTRQLLQSRFYTVILVLSLLLSSHSGGDGQAKHGYKGSSADPTR